MSEDSAPRVAGALHSIDGSGVVCLSVTYDRAVDSVWLAITDPGHLAHWYGKVEGDLRVGGEFTALVTSSNWDGRGRVDSCVPRGQLAVTLWAEEGKERSVVVELFADGNDTRLELETRGLPLEWLWAFGSGWQVHVEHLGAHLAGRELSNSAVRMRELEPIYRDMPVVPLER